MTATPTKPIADAAPSSYVLPKPPRERADLVVQPGPSWRAGLDARADAVRELGARLQALVECQGRFLGEMATTVAEMDASVHEETRARLKGQVRTMAEILAWAGAVHSDLDRECRRAAAGGRVVDLVAAAREVGGAFEAASGRAVTVIGAAAHGFSGDAAALCDLLDQALHLVARRASRGAIAIEIGENAGWRNIRVLANGEPVPIVEPDLVARFRRTARELGVTILPDDLGPGGTSIVMRLTDSAA